MNTTHEVNLQIGVKSSPERVFETLTDTARLAQWWTSDTRGSGAKAGDELEFRFGKFCQTFKVKAVDPGKLVEWKATELGAAEWAGTEITFALSTDDRQTLIHFKHAGWRASTPFFAHCSMKWATFMMSLKDLLETGTGRPAPNDIPITCR